MHSFITQQPTLLGCIPGRVEGDFYDDDDNDDEDKDNDKDHNEDDDDMYDDIFCNDNVTWLIALVTTMSQQFCTTMMTRIMTMKTSFYYCGAGKIVLATTMLRG